jgi:hypothetical protein
MDIKLLLKEQEQAIQAEILVIQRADSGTRFTPTPETLEIARSVAEKLAVQLIAAFVSGPLYSRIRDLWTRSQIEKARNELSSERLRSEPQVDEAALLHDLIRTGTELGLNSGQMQAIAGTVYRHFRLAVSVLGQTD